MAGIVVVEKAIDGLNTCRGGLNSLNSLLPPDELGCDINSLVAAAFEASVIPQPANVKKISGCG